MHYSCMKWDVLFHNEFEPEFAGLPQAVQDELLARLKLLEKIGPALGRPNVDTLEGSSFPNMKELRFQLDGLWRFIFAFDPARQAIVLVGGNKQGQNQARFYRNLIKMADARFAAHVAELNASNRSGK
jgi:hypothetical protein